MVVKKEKDNGQARILDFIGRCLRVVVFIDFHIAYDFARNNCIELSLYTGALVIG